MASTNKTQMSRAERRKKKNNQKIVINMAFLFRLEHFR